MFYSYKTINNTDGLDISTNYYYKDIDLSSVIDTNSIIAVFACNNFLLANNGVFVISSSIISNSDKTIRIYFNKEITSPFPLGIFGLIM